MNNPNEILIALAREVSESVCQQLGEATIDSIFVGGSVAKNEASAFELAEGLEIYSDVDLFVVLTDDADTASCRNKVTEIKHRHALKRNGWEVMGAPDIGIFTRTGLASQPNRPGTAALDQHHILLYGNEDTPRRVRFTPETIPPHEALYLLENRALENADMDERKTLAPFPEIERYAFYTAIKSGLDMATATLVALGRYSALRSKRSQLFADLERSGDLDGLVPEDARRAIRFCHDCIDNIDRAFSEERDRLERLHADMDVLLASMWCALGERIQGRDRAGVSFVLEQRASANSRTAHLRELRILAKRMRIPLARAISNVGLLSRFSPLATLRLSGVLAAIANEPERFSGVERLPALVSYVESITDMFGFRNGNLFRRGRELYRAVT